MLVGAYRVVGGRARGRLRRAIDELATTIERSRRVIAQPRRRLARQQPDSATRLVSLLDPDARPIAKGRINGPVEFGYKAQVVDNADGIVRQENQSMASVNVRYIVDDVDAAISFY